MHFLLPLVLLIGASTNVKSELDVDNLCILDEDPETETPFVECLCQRREDFTYTSMFVYNINRITIKGCGSVHLGFDSLSNLHLEELELEDLESLVIEPFSLFYNEKIERLKISHIGSLVLEKHTFFGFRNAYSFILENVTVEKLSKDAFKSVSNIEVMRIEDSVFEYIEELGFFFLNVSVLEVTKTEFRVVESNSFTIIGSETVKFEGCSFESTANESFSITNVNTLFFHNCTFENIAPNWIQTYNINYFSFSNSKVEELEPYAFANLEVLKKLTFQHNLMQAVSNNSLHSIINPTTDSIELDYCCNTLACDCNIFWLWNLKKQDFLETNYCLGDSLSNISDLIPITNSNDDCLTLQPKVSEQDQHWNASYKPMINIEQDEASCASYVSSMSLILTLVFTLCIGVDF